MMKLLLYYNKPHRYSFNVLLGALEKSSAAQYSIVCCFNYNKLIEQILKCDRPQETIILAIAFFSTEVEETRQILTTIRAVVKKSKLIVIGGGPHATAKPQESLALGFDIIVCGEGELTFSLLMDRLAQGADLVDISDIRGLAFLTNAQSFVFTGVSTATNLDTFPPFSLRLRKVGPIEITRGCPHACYFCQTPSFFGTRVRHRSVDNICEHVRGMTEIGLFDIRLLSPNAFSYGSNDGKTLNLHLLEQLCVSIRSIIGPKGRISLGTYPAEVRPEHVCDETLSLVKNLANNDNIVIGAQSGSQRILDGCHRGHTVDDIYRSVALTVKYGFKAYVDIIFGLPHETATDVHENFRLIKDLLAMGAKIHAHAFMPLPQTRFANAKPAIIDTFTQRQIRHLETQGNLFGEWQQQLQYTQNSLNL